MVDALLSGAASASDAWQSKTRCLPVRMRTEILNAMKMCECIVLRKFAVNSARLVGEGFTVGSGRATLDPVRVIALKLAHVYIIIMNKCTQNQCLGFRELKLPCILLSPQNSQYSSTSQSPNTAQPYQSGNVLLFACDIVAIGLVMLGGLQLR